MVALDSAANRRLLGSEDRDRLRGMLPAKYRSLLGEIRAEAESGLETLVRLRLLAVGVEPRIQVKIVDGIRVDFLVEDWLIIEADGRQFHDDPRAFERDRERDLFLKAVGFEVLRLSYAQIVGDWPSCETAILRMLAHRHRLRGSQLMVWAGDTHIPSPT